MHRLLLIFAAVLALAACRMDTGKALEAGSDLYQAATLDQTQIMAMGKETAAQMDKDNQVAASGSAYAKRLSGIISSLRNTDGLSLNYKVYMTSEVNAFALPDGSIRVYSGLMDMMEDDELYFVIGHEIGHVKNGDTAARFRMVYATSAARKGAAAAGGAAAVLSASQLGDIGEAFIQAQFSQSQESSADKFGLKLMERNGKNTAAAVSALRKLATPGSKGSMFSSHPDANARAEKVDSLRKK